MSLTARQILIALNNKFNGNWNNIYNHMVNKCEMDENPDLTGENELITILDSDYPEDLKSIYKPPFVITKQEAEMKVYEFPIVFKIKAHTLEQAKELAMGELDFDTAKIGKVRLAK